MARVAVVQAMHAPVDAATVCRELHAAVPSLAVHGTPCPEMDARPSETSAFASPPLYSLRPDMQGILQFSSAPAGPANLREPEAVLLCWHRLLFRCQWYNFHCPFPCLWALFRMSPWGSATRTGDDFSYFMAIQCNCFGRTGARFTGLPDAEIDPYAFGRALYTQLQRHGTLQHHSQSMGPVTTLG